MHYILARYFSNSRLDDFNITKYEYYQQCDEICDLFGYKRWKNDFLLELYEYASNIIKRDSNPNYLALSLLDFLEDKKIVRPGYTTLQDAISFALITERNRLKLCLQEQLLAEDKQSLQLLLKNESTISELAALKKDAKNFTSTMMRIECKKHSTLKPLYKIAKIILPRLSISKQNISYYGSLANHYTIFDLNRFNEEQTYLYLLCYVFTRYQQIHDNLMIAFDFYVKKFENDIKPKAEINYLKASQNDDKSIGKLLSIYVDDTLENSVAFGEIRDKAFKILPRSAVQVIAEKLSKKTQSKQEIKWKERDKISMSYKRHIRPLFMQIDFSSIAEENHLLIAIDWIKLVFSKNKSLSKEPDSLFPRDFISKRVEPYIINQDSQGNIISVNSNRYEILIYQQIVKQITTSYLYMDDSIRHRAFVHELSPIAEKDKLIKTDPLPWLTTNSAEKLLNPLLKELEALWTDFNAKLKRGELKHLKYDFNKKEVMWVKPRLSDEENEQKRQQQKFYDKLPSLEIMDVFRFVNEQCNFISGFTPLQPRYNKLKNDEDNLVAVLISQAFGFGNYKMSQSSDISYPTLESTYQQYLRVATLKKANDIITDSISKLSIFPHFIFDQDILYGGVDGQKYIAETPTSKSRFSEKYFNKGQGVVAYTLLSNHIPLQTELIGANEHESYFVFDIWYNNTSSIDPAIITGDMHSINKANFALMHWFEGELRPRFSNLKKELNNIFCSKDLSHYQKFLVQPAGQINKELICKEKDAIDQIIITLGLKEMNQSTLVRKLCSLSPNNTTRRAVFEFDKLIRSIYTLKCILDPEILVNSHRSQNRVESYHNLRAAISSIGGKKSLIGSTDLEMEISNQCGRLISNVIIYYNAFLLSKILETQIGSNKRKLKMLKKISPVAWQHIHFMGHYTFYEKRASLDIEEIIGNIEFI